MRVWVIYLLLLLLLSQIIQKTRAQGKYYSFDGRGNNIIFEDLGAADTAYSRGDIKAAYIDQGSISFCDDRPDARVISNSLVVPLHMESADISLNASSSLLPYLGLFFMQDIIDTKEAETEPYPIPVPYCDLNFDKTTCSLGANDTYPQKKTLEYNRSAYVIVNGYRQQINMVTAYLDGSMIYGSDGETVAKLRSYLNGKMATYDDQVPLNIMGLPMQSLPGKDHFLQLRAAGDRRANIDPVSLALHSLFLLEHNRLATALQKEHPEWTDDDVFFEARKWNIAFLQKICFYEFLPELGIQLPKYHGYLSHTDSSITNFFAVVTSQFLESQKTDIVYRIDNLGLEVADDHLLLCSSYFSPTESLSVGIEPILRGAIASRTKKVSPFFSRALRNYFLATSLEGSSDFVSMAIQRGRDHGIPDYNAARLLLGLKAKESFSEITPDLLIQNKLMQIYGSLNKIDAFVGALAESPYRNSRVGELLYISLSNQFASIREGDRLYFENTENLIFSTEQIKIIHSTSFKDIILRNTDISLLPENIYIYNSLNPWPVSNSEEVQSETGSMAASAMEIMRASAYILYWRLEKTESSEYMVFTIKCKTNGFVGLGFAKDEDSRMVEADIIVVYVAENTISVEDYWADSFSTPKLDVSLGGTKDVEMISGSQEDGITTVEFKRKIETGDKLDRDISRNGNTSVIFSWHSSSDILQYHSSLTRGRKNIDFFGKLRDLENSLNFNSAITVDKDIEFLFSWFLDPSDPCAWIDISISYKTGGLGCVGFGIKGPGINNETDFMIIENASYYCKIGDYWSVAGDSGMKEDYLYGGDRDFLSDQCTVKDKNFVNAKFRRLLKTGDALDNEILSGDFSDVIFLWNTQNNKIDNSTMTKQRQFQINFFAADKNLAWMPVSPVEGVESKTKLTSSDTEVVTVDTVEVENISREVPDLLETQFDEDSFVQLTEGYKVWYKLSEVTSKRRSNRKMAQEELADDRELIIKLQRESTGWMGFGIDPADTSISGMEQTDVYFGWVFDNGTVNIFDGWAIGFMKPLPDMEQGGSNDILEYAGEQVDGITTLIFKRKVNSGDAFDRPIRNGEQDIVFSFGDGDALPPGGHGPCCRGKAKINFTQKPSKVQVAVEEEGAKKAKNGWMLNIMFMNVHGLIMVFSWSILCLVGLTISRLGRHMKNWELYHISLECTATALSIIGEVFSLLFMQGKIRNAHGILSFLILIGSLVQLFIGYLTYTRRTMNLKKGHRAMGYFIFGTAVWQSWSGMRILKVDVRVIHCFYAWLISSGISFHFASEGTSYDEMKAAFIKGGMLPEDFLDKDEKRRKSSIATTKNSTKSVAIVKESIIKAGEKIMGKKSSKGNMRKSGKGKTMTVDEFVAACEGGQHLTVINKKVYDMSTLIERHPGGSENIMDIIGRDGTCNYNKKHRDSKTAHRMLAKTFICDTAGDLSIIRDNMEEDDGGGEDAHFTI